MNIPVTVIVVAKNEGARVGPCLAALSEFDQIIVVDSASTDNTKQIVSNYSVEIIDFIWNGRYPKKRQSCLDHVPCRHDWVLFIDADEIVTTALKEELRALFAEDKTARYAGYFVTGYYRYQGRRLRFGLKNRKIALLNRHKMMFPPVDDLDLPGMGEIEGHYQPVRRAGYEAAKIGRLAQGLWHDALDDEAGWRARHENYACWEAGMNRKKAWPRDPVLWRQVLKKLFRALPGRAAAAFIHCYIFKAGFLDGKPGWHLACRRAEYYAMIRRAARKERAPG